MRESMLKDWDDVFDSISEQRKAEQARYDASVPEPASIYAPKNATMEWHYFNMDGDVIRVTKRKGGYDRYSERHIEQGEIDAILKAMDRMAEQSTEPTGGTK